MQSVSTTKLRTRAPKAIREQMQSSITTKGQATIPKPIREHLQLQPGDRVKFFINPDGTVVMLPKLPASALRGMLGVATRRVSLEEMEEAIVQGATNRFKQADRG